LQLAGPRWSAISSSSKFLQGELTAS